MIEELYRIYMDINLYGYRTCVFILVGLGIWAGTPWAAPCPALTLRIPVLFAGPNSLAATWCCDVW